MDFELSETEQLIQRTARDYAERKLLPVAGEIDEKSRFPMAEVRGLGELGLLGVNVPASFGGAEAGPVAYALSMMEIARGCASTAVTMAVTNMVGEIICRFGNDAQRAAYVPKLTSGEFAAGSFALSEPGAGSDPGGMQTTATPTANGFALNGAKAWVTSGAHAGVIVVWARTAPRETHPGAKGISCFLVEQGTPGLKVGPAERKMGLKGSNTVSLTFEDCRIPASAQLGQPQQGFAIAMMALDGGRIGISAQATGIAMAALEEAAQYAKDRRQFDRPISDFQAIQWFLADSRTELDAGRLLCLRAAQLKLEGKPFTREASMAKLFASEAAGRICDRNLQVHGGYGYVHDFAAERHVRDVRVTRIYEGTSEIQRTVIARSVLRG
ncbi:MAG TPA: acyl-CoA dehydrogenase family protein [Polyangiaceae bacterium]|jgi:alkylation response protein AidB-like acyl-CoA dehydrogenase|nr:acyl-CoA dehydrogenase family protein [Polyangiaceae bacterium]